MPCGEEISLCLPFVFTTFCFVFISIFSNFFQFSLMLFELSPILFKFSPIFFEFLFNFLFIVSKKLVHFLQIKTNMALAIVSSIVAFSQCGVYCVAIWYYRTYSICTFGDGNRFWQYYSYRDYICTSPDATTGTALYATLTVAMVAEFGISLAVSIYCCKHGGNGCCGNPTGGVSLTCFICLLAKVPRLAWEVNSCCFL